jgi:hypothetical protein
LCVGAAVVSVVVVGVGFIEAAVVGSFRRFLLGCREGFQSMLA